MNGKVLEVSHFDDSTYTTLNYRFDKNQFKRQRIDLREARRAGRGHDPFFSSEKGKSVPVVLKSGSLDRRETFSYSEKGKGEQLYYYYDEPVGNIASVEEMRAFVMGERDARYGVSGKGWFYSGLVVGLATGYASRTSVLAFAVPPLFSLGAKIPIINIKEEHILDSKYQYNEDYAAGYEQYARSKNTREALKGSAIGTVIGLVLFAIIDNNS